MKTRTLFIALAALAALSSCKSQYELLLQSGDTDKKYDTAFEYFNAGKYGRAAELFESLSMEVSGMEKEDTVLYYWGLSNYRNRDFYTAETNFLKFRESFPQSTLAEDAAFLRVDCLYRQTMRYELDQMPTYKAISAIGEFMTEYPDNPQVEICHLMLSDLGERLDRKAYENARIYYKMDEFKEARVALKNVLKEDADNIYREDILYYTAMASFRYAENSVKQKQKERYMWFVDDYYNFVGEYPESSHRRELDGLYRKAQKALGKSVEEIDAEREQEK